MSRHCPRPAGTIACALATVATALALAPASWAVGSGGLKYGAASQSPVTSPGGVDPAVPLPALPGEAVPDPVPGEVARILPGGLALAPADAPAAVAAIIRAGNRIAKARYRWGGGHARWEDTGYDCSGSVSYALHGAGLLERAMPSGGFTRWGDPGPGRWVTIYAKRSHMYMVVAGLRFDTSGRKRAGTRWQADMRPPKGYRVRHPAGL